MVKKITYNALTGDVFVDLTPHLSEIPNLHDNVEYGEAAYNAAVAMINDRKVGEYKLPAGTKVGKLSPMETFDLALKGMSKHEVDRLVRDTAKREAMLRPLAPAKQTRSNEQIDRDVNEALRRMMVNSHGVGM